MSSKVKKRKRHSAEQIFQLLLQNLYDPTKEALSIADIVRRTGLPFFTVRKYLNFIKQVVEFINTKGRIEFWSGRSLYVKVTPKLYLDLEREVKAEVERKLKERELFEAI